MLLLPVTVFLLVLLSIAKSNVIVLTSNNFEHDTQASSGSTTGDWLIKYYAPWCGHCNKMAPMYDELAKELDGSVNVAKIDVTANRDLGRRFNISGFPTLKFLRLGRTYDYQGPRTLEALKEFVTGGYSKANVVSYPTPAAKSSFEDFFGEFFSIYTRAYNDFRRGKYFSQSVIMVCFPLLMLLIVLSSCCLSVDTDDNGGKAKEE